MGKSSKKLLPFTIIENATNGDNLAIYQVLNHYDNYINKVCIRSFQYNNEEILKKGVDMEMKGDIQIALINMILKFDINTPI